MARRRGARSGRRERRAAWLPAALAVGVVGALLVAERRRALRAPSQPQGERVVRNLAVAGVSAVAVHLVERPVVAPLARRVASRRLGLLYWLQDRLGLSGAVRDALAVVLLDYSLYWWHVVEHRVPALYRFHQVHHADLDLDVSTAARFHFGEMLLSVPWRAAQVLAIGVSPRALSAWQGLTVLSVAFHHSNARLPIAVERWLSRVIMTPRLHGIHHSIVREEQDSNWSSGLTLWDRLHGTLRANVPQGEIEIGVPDYRAPEDVTFPRLMEMPFREEGPTGRLPDGTVPAPHHTSAPRAGLLP